MKKIVLALCAIALSFGAFAQLSNQPAKGHAPKSAPDWWNPIVQDVTATDINGNTISTAEIREAGKGMIIDFSATWCSWCWVMHTNGILEAIHDQLGNDVEVLWVEADPTTTDPAEITGSGSTQGDWTNGGTVPYPIIDDANFTGIIGSSNISGYPTVVFISPTGYWCDMYGTDWGFGPYDANGAVSAVQNILGVYPMAGQLPLVKLNAAYATMPNEPLTITPDLISVDEVVSYEWTVDGGTAPALDQSSVTVTYPAVGNYQVSYTVTNTTGSTTKEFTVTVFEWDDEMSYNLLDEQEGALGGINPMVWGVKYPASQMAGRTHLYKVSLFLASSAASGKYTLTVYQGGENAPETQLYTRDYMVAAGINSVWYDFYPHEQSIALDDTKNLWISFSKSGGYPATYSQYVGFDDGDLLKYQGQWITGAYVGYPGEWMINVTTKDHVGISEIGNSSVELYPNPTTGILNINAEGLQEVNVMDLSGRTLMTVNDNVVNISELNAGVYVVRIVSATGVSTQKVVKK